MYCQKCRNRDQFSREVSLKSYLGKNREDENTRTTYFCVYFCELCGVEVGSGLETETVTAYIRRTCESKHKGKLRVVEFNNKKIVSDNLVSREVL